MIESQKPRNTMEKLGPSVVLHVREVRRQLEEAAEHDIHRLVESARIAAVEFRKKYPAASKEK